MADVTAVSAEQMRATIDRFFRGCSRMDFAEAAAAFAEDAVLDDPKGSEQHRGRAAIEEFYTGVGGLMESLDLAADEVFTSGGEAAATWTARYKGKNGRSGEIRGIDVYTFDGEGLLTSLTGYWDAGRMVADLTA